MFCKRFIMVPVQGLHIIIQVTEQYKFKRCSTCYEIIALIWGQRQITLSAEGPSGPNATHQEPTSQFKWSKLCAHVSRRQNWFRSQHTSAGSNSVFSIRTREQKQLVGPNGKNTRIAFPKLVCSNKFLFFKFEHKSSWWQSNIHSYYQLRWHLQQSVAKI